MAVEARMRCGEVTKHPPQTYNDPDGEVETQQHDVLLSAVLDADDEETKKWSVWTPQATLEMTVMNPEAARYFEPGQEYRIIITKLQPQQARTP